MDKIVYTGFYKSPIGLLEVRTGQNTLHSVTFLEEGAQVAREIQHPFLKECLTQLKEYFEGHRKEFDLALEPAGTEFQRNVWTELRKIPFGEKQTYLQLARKLGNVKAIRAVASANGANPILIIVPCHRVLGTDGKLTGYSAGLHRKQWLLEHEAKFGKGLLTLF